MGLLVEVAGLMNSLGLRKPVASLGSLAYGWKTGGRQSFSTDSSGRWLNRQPEATIVSPTIHTTSYDSYRAWVLDNWAFGYMPKAGDTVIDVGSGVGEEAVVFSRLVGPTGRVIAVEAHPQTFACLNETIRLSGLDNVTAPCVAIADGEGSTTIVDTQNHLTSSIMVSGSGVEVLTRSLDSLADELEIGKIALLKMNIEGAERLAVRGMSHLSDRLENVVISCHDFLADRGNGEELRTKDNVRSTLESYGYKIMTRPDHPLPWVRDYLYGSKVVS